MKQILFVFSLLLYSQSLFAQYNDQHYKQVKSMETGPWDFSPDWYYYWLHKSYSGAESYWKWAFLNSGWRVRFKEEKSSVKRVLPVREKASAVQLLKQKEVEEERKQIKQVHDAELKQALDRNVDLVFSSYNDDFQRLNKQCLEGFNYILKESKYKLSSNVTELSKELNRINERIHYTHKTGAGYGLENAKREEAYILAKKDLEKLLLRTRRLALRANLLY